jgi:hypothetical protein
MQKRILIRIKRKIKSYTKRISRRLRMQNESTLARKLRFIPSYPSVSATPSQAIELTINDLHQVFEILAKNVLIKLNIVLLEDFLGENDGDGNYLEYAEKLRVKFNHFGSDKSGIHNYHLLYGAILNRLQIDSPNIFEVGLGTNNTDTPSNMGLAGVPGASLRAWREISQNGVIVGADIDDRVLFQENGISTYHLDQTSKESWESLLNQISGTKFNLVVDDGLHAPGANLFFLEYAPKILNQDLGIVIVEDIAEWALPVWEIYNSNLSSGYSLIMIKTKSAYVAMIQNTANQLFS